MVCKRSYRKAYTNRLSSFVLLYDYALHVSIYE